MNCLAMKGWKETSVDGLLAAIEAKRAPDAARLLFGLGIRHVGAITARDLMKMFVDAAGAAHRRPRRRAPATPRRSSGSR